MNHFKYKEILVHGLSTGGIETCLILPRYHIAIDSGRGPHELIEIPTLFLSHGHLDHSSAIAYYISQRSLRNLPAPDVYVPKKLQKPLKKIIALWSKIENFKYPVNI